MITKNNTHLEKNINNLPYFNLFEPTGSQEPVCIFNNKMKGGILE